MSIFDRPRSGTLRLSPWSKHASQISKMNSSRPSLLIPFWYCANKIPAAKCIRRRDGLCERRARIQRPLAESEPSSLPFFFFFESLPLDELRESRELDGLELRLSPIPNGLREAASELLRELRELVAASLSARAS